MSLINDVLRDLERRNAPEPDDAPRPVSRKSGTWPARSWRWSLWLIAALALGGVLHLSLRDASAPSPAVEPAPLAAQAGTQAPPEPAAAAVATLPASEQETEHPAPTPSSDPVGEMAQQAPSTSDPVQSRQPALSEYDSQEGSPGEPGETGAPADETDPPQRAAEPARTQARTQPASSPAEEDSPTISIRRSDSGAETSDPLIAAKRLIARGQLRRAESRLERLVEEQPKRSEAHQLLADTLMRQRREAEAIRALESGLTQAEDPAALAAELGRLLINGGAPARARSVLEKHAPPLSEAPDYHLLLAAAHRRTGDHAAAALHYRQLTEAVPRRGAAWIGLGASLESLDRPAEAIEAYNRALDGDDARAVRFARQRLTALKPITGEAP